MKKENICKFADESELRALRAANFVYESKSPSSDSFQIRSEHMMCLVAEGEGSLHTEKGTHALLPGCLFFTFLGQAFRIENTGGLVYMYISFTGERAEELFSRFGISAHSCRFTGYEELVPLWMDRLVRADTMNIDLLAESVLLYSFAKLRYAPTEKRSVLDRVLECIDENYRAPALSLAGVAEAVGYNAKYLSHLFKTELGRGFADYVTIVRIDHAVFLIGQGVTSVKNLAILCGYSDPLYFSKVFRKVIGLSPRDYIAQL